MAKNISDVAEFINLYLNAIRPKYEDIQQRYKAIFSNLHLLEAEANNIARASVIKSFEEAYIDPDTDLANAIASCIKVKLTGDFNSGDIKYEIIDEFKNQNMLKTWNLKDGGIGKSKVRTKGIARRSTRVGQNIQFNQQGIENILQSLLLVRSMTQKIQTIPFFGVQPYLHVLVLITLNM